MKDIYFILSTTLTIVTQMDLCITSKYPLTGLMSPVPLLIEWVVQQSEGFAVRLSDCNCPQVDVSLAKNTEPMVSPKGASRALHGSSHPLGTNGWMDERPL